MCVFIFIRRIAEGEPIIIFGDGSQSRDFTFVDDIARGTVAALKPLGYEVINLGGDRTVGLRMIIEQIAELTGKKPVIEYRPAHPADVPTTSADVSKAARLLGWRPQVSVEEGIRRCVDWYRDNREMAKSLELCDRKD
jgi:UDP-glucuronate 4-epimerase